MSLINISNSKVAFSKLLNTASFSRNFETLPSPLFALVIIELKPVTVELILLIIAGS